MKTLMITILGLTTVTMVSANEIVYKASPEIEEFIQQSEGFQACAYVDHKANSIGYGTQKLENGNKVPLKVKGKKFCISKERAVELSNLAIESKSDLIIAYALDNSLEINQEMLDSLTSFAYNIGSYGAFRSSVVKHLKNGKCKLAVASLLTFNKASGKELKGLTIRRQHEAKLLESGCKKLTKVYKDYAPKAKKGKK